MNIKRIFNKNQKLIGYVILIIVGVLFAIKSLNSYYEKVDELKSKQMAENDTNNQIVETPENTPDYYATESNSVEKTMRSFVQYCNNRELENAYKMLTEECKNAMFPTVEDFEKIYINNVYKVAREYELLEWSTDGNKTIYQVTLYGDMLSSGNSHDLLQEYYTFIKDDEGNFKLNVNNYIYGEDKNIKTTVNSITVEIGLVDVYDEYEEAQIIITNNSSNMISLTGNKYNKNIYLQNSKDVTYSSLNSRFDTENIIMEPNSTKIFIVRFNKVYSATNKADYLVLSDVILNYEDYLKSENKSSYSNRTSLKIQYQK